MRFLVQVRGWGFWDCERSTVLFFKTNHFLFFENTTIIVRIKRLKSGFQKLTKEKARIIAHLIGDGAHYISGHDYNLKYEVRDEESLKQFNDGLIKVYGLKPSWYWNKSGITGEPIKFVRLRSKLAFEDLLRYATFFSKDWCMKNPLLKAPKEITKEFLSAFFDDEGSVCGMEIRLYSINKKGLFQVKRILNDFSIKSRIQSGYGCKRNVFALVVRDKKLFFGKIGFGLERKQQKLQRILR